MASQSEAQPSADRVSRTRVLWGIRIASKFCGIAICAAVVWFFKRYWGLGVFLQVATVSIVPLFVLGCAEWAAGRERKPYLTGLLALLALASFVMNLMVLGSIFNINSSEHALLAWGAFATAVAYRYGLRWLLAIGLLLLIAHGALTWMPKYWFFAAIGTAGIAMMVILKKIRGRRAQKGVLP